MEKVNTTEYYNDKLFHFTKRSIDLVVSIIAVLILLPLFTIICLFYLLGDNKGPILFSQERIGKDGKKFKILKFRSMIVDADIKLRNNKELYKKYIENSYKLEPDEDPRITKFGAFIRRTSIDELPQFINVIKGDMSLVGPRPIVKEELNEYKDQKKEFVTVKPGITGYWQVSGRSDIGYPERVELEMFYVKNQSLLLDLKILINTVLVVIFKKGAY